VAVLGHQKNPLPEIPLKDMEIAGRALGMKLQIFELRDEDDLDRAFSVIVKANSGAVLVLPAGFFANNRSRVVNLAATNRLPSMYTNRSFAEAGGLIA
jgi:hypothetical protein